MNKQWMAVVAAVTLVQGCATVDRGSIPVVDSGAPVSEEVAARQGYRAPAAVATFLFVLPPAPNKKAASSVPIFRVVTGPPLF